MPTSQSAQSPCDDMPKNISLADVSLSANAFGLLLLWMLFCFADESLD